LLPVVGGRGQNDRGAFPNFRSLTFFASLCFSANAVFEQEGSLVFEHSCLLGCEGIVSKRKHSRYRSGRSPRLAQDEEPKRTCCEARGGRGLGQMTRAYGSEVGYRFPMPASGRSCCKSRRGVGPPPSGIRSPRSGPRHSRSRSSPGGRRAIDLRTTEAIRCRGTRSRALPAALAHVP
jgi:hypothetical protein